MDIGNGNISITYDSWLRFGEITLITDHDYLNGILFTIFNKITLFIAYD